MLGDPTGADEADVDAASGWRAAQYTEKQVRTYPSQRDDDEHVCHCDSEVQCSMRTCAAEFKHILSQNCV